jgi:hypothetical protein
VKRLLRSVRNLNENAQIEQYKLDKILKDLDADVLYDAIINDKIDNIRAKNDAQKYLTLTLWCFYTLSQDTYSRVFMSERYKMPSFLSVKETSAIAGKDMNMNAYKKHRWLYL